MGSVSGVTSQAQHVDPTKTATQPKKTKKHHGHHHGHKPAAPSTTTPATQPTKSASVGGTLDATA